MIHLFQPGSKIPTALGHIVQQTVIYSSWSDPVSDQNLPDFSLAERSKFNLCLFLNRHYIWFAVTH